MLGSRSVCMWHHRVSCSSGTPTGQGHAINVLTTLACLKTSLCVPSVAEIAAAMGVTCSGSVLERDCFAHELHPIQEHGIAVHQDALGLLAAVQPGGVDASWAGLLYKVMHAPHELPRDGCLGCCIQLSDRPVEPWFAHAVVDGSPHCRLMSC